MQPELGGFRLINFIKHFFMIFTGIIIMRFLYYSFFEPDAVFDLQYFREVFLFSFLGDLPELVYVSKKPLTKEMWNIRTAIHTVLLVAIIIGAGFALDCLHSLTDVLSNVAGILVIDIFVRFMDYTTDLKTADEINKKIDARRRG